MRIATFFQPIKDNEKLDVHTVITVPDQSLSVKDILKRFTRGSMIIPPIEEGMDDDIDSITIDTSLDPVEVHQLYINSRDNLCTIIDSSNYEHQAKPDADNIKADSIREDLNAKQQSE